ncbi:hypothetical protein AGOR_G00019970 [Albula goreensis]|uniref:Profilin n=1 Tax=Albula goreensis TaxID=1534307 RepID=A0A8T3E0Q3_9TELE|nr:hypothetical protein AGOR_G00019970 [Albula goreensis]
MSWDAHVDDIMQPDNVIDCAIVGCLPGQELMWGSFKDGTFRNITSAEVKALMTSERSSLLSNGVTLGNIKCTVLRDMLFDPDSDTDTGTGTMDLRTKATGNEPTYCICVVKTKTALVFVKGKPDSHGGNLNVVADKKVSYLKSCGY